MGVDTSYTVMTIKAPAVLKIETFIISFCELRKVEHTFAMLGPQRRWWKLWSSVSPFYNRTPFYSTKLVKHTRYSDFVYFQTGQRSGLSKFI